MKDKTGIKIGLIALVVITCVVGLILTEIQTTNYQTQTKILQTNAADLNKKAPEIAKVAIDKLLAAPQLQITDEQSLNILGCEYTSSYTGIKNGTEEYARNKTAFHNYALIPSICKSEYEQLMSVFDLQVFWDNGTVYKKNLTDEDFLKQDTTDRQLITRPSQYLSKYFKAYRPFPQFKSAKSDGKNYTITLNDTEDKKQTEYILQVNDSNTITNITYTTTEEGSISLIQGKISLSYDNKLARPENFLTGKITPYWVSDQFVPNQNSLTINYDETTIEFNSKSKELSLYSPETKTAKKVDYTCSIQNQDCYTKYLYALDQLKAHINTQFTQINQGECTELRKRALGSKSEQFIKTTIIYPDSKFNAKLEIETDTLSGKTVITKYGSNFTCYETQATKSSLEDVIKTILDQALL